ncbi:AraC family transcriptional regulator [Gorillibacterium massiliense]|uniref:AraC family transcriptional regulator n=1 Tax=Gorillibacterium massiliense TaxID=1280390 RepID=UPI0004AFAAD4|nr:AraC family transcriptional regulator [Gorillibacterium massiliense]
MKAKMLLKEKAVHGTALLPAAIHHLSYPQGEDTFFYLHWHYEFELVAVLSGAIVYTVEDEEFCIKAGEGLFISSNRLHAARSLDGMPCEACVVVFHPNLFGDQQQGSAYSKFVYPFLKGEVEYRKVLTGGEAWQRTIIQRMNEIDKLKDSNLSETELLLKSKLFEVWHYLYQNAVPAATPGRDGDGKAYKIDRMQPVLNYIHTSYKEEIALKDLADLLPMSEGQFCHAFKEVTNMSPIAYVIRYRILQSCSLLTETDSKIADIARSVGFNNISYFNREFAKAIGCSPSRYRREG